MFYEYLSFISSTLALIAGGGWFVYYRANKRIKEGEADESQANGWKKQQEVYQTTIDDLKESCEYIKNDRNLLREENTKLREENNILREKINNMEEQMYELKAQIQRLGRIVKSLQKDEKEIERQQRKVKKDGDN